MDNITPKKCLIVASGVDNHKEYVDLVKERLGDLLPVPEHYMLGLHLNILEVN